MELPKVNDKMFLLVVEKDTAIRTLFCDWCLKKDIKLYSKIDVRFAIKEFCDYLMNYLADAYGVDETYEPNN